MSYKGPMRSPNNVLPFRSPYKFQVYSESGSLIQDEGQMFF